MTDRADLDLGEDWVLDTDHPFVGMDVKVEAMDGDTIAGSIAGIWVYQGEPRRLDVERDGGPRFNADRERVGVTG